MFPRAVGVGDLSFAVGADDTDAGLFITGSGVNQSITDCVGRGDTFALAVDGSNARTAVRVKPLNGVASGSHQLNRAIFAENAWCHLTESR